MNLGLAIFFLFAAVYFLISIYADIRDKKWRKTIYYGLLTVCCIGLGISFLT